MKELSRVKTNKRVCGLDLGDKTSQVCICSFEGDIEFEGRIRTTKQGLLRRFQGVEPMRIALETGMHSPWVSRLLERCGHEVIVATYKVRLIGNSRKKSDRIDARTLADLASVRPRLLSPIQHISAQAQADRGVLRARDALVRARSGLISHARGLVKALGERLPASSAEAFAKKAAGAVPVELAPALTPILQTVSEMTLKIRDYDRQIAELIDGRYSQAKSLMQIKGVGPITALAYVLALGDPKRFTHSRILGAYFGLVPAQRSSGSSDPQLRITKQGDPYVRRLLVQCAHYILGPFGQDCDLRRHGERIATTGGKNAKKRATVAVARKLAVLLHRLLLSGKPYEPLRQSPLQAAA
jgi:transposase